MKVKVSLESVFYVIGRFYFFFLDYFHALLLPLTKRQSVCGMSPSLCTGEGEVPVLGSLRMLGMALQGARDSPLGTNLLVVWAQLGNTCSGQGALLFLVSQTDAFELGGMDKILPPTQPLQAEVWAGTLSHGGEVGQRRVVKGAQLGTQSVLSQCPRMLRLRCPRCFPALPHGHGDIFLTLAEQQQCHSAGDFPGYCGRYEAGTWGCLCGCHLWPPEPPRVLRA